MDDQPNQSPSRSPRAAVGATVCLTALTLLALGPSPAGGQQSFRACYVPAVGAIYMIGLSGLPSECLSGEHEEITWTEGGAVGAGEVGTTHLADGAVTGPKLADRAVTTQKIALDAITTDEIAPNSVATVEIADGSIQTADLGDGSITSAKLAGDVTIGVQDGSIGTAQLADQSVTGGKLAHQSIDSEHIGERSLLANHFDHGVVGTLAVQDQSLTADDLADNSVGSAEIQDGAVGPDEIATGAVGGAELATWSVDFEKIQDGAVQSRHILNGGVGGHDLAEGAVGERELSSEVNLPVAWGHVKFAQDGVNADCDCSGATVFRDANKWLVYLDGVSDWDPREYLFLGTAVNGRWVSWLDEGSHPAIIAQVWDEAGNANLGEMQFVVFRNR